MALNLAHLRLANYDDDPTIFVAVDMASYYDAEELVYKLGNTVDLKLGLEFFIKNGLEGCNLIRNKGATKKRKLFLDLKLHDIPNTVAGAVRSALEIEPDFLTLHTCDGVEPLVAARKVADKAKYKTKLLGVTVLTSVGGNVTQLVKQRAEYAKLAGLDGLVCSPHEIEMLKDLYPDMYLMVPGIQDGQSNDQKRTTTARDAYVRGADGMVIGRQIRDAEDPLIAALGIRATLKD